MPTASHRRQIVTVQPSLLPSVCAEISTKSLGVLFVWGKQPAQKRLELPKSFYPVVQCQQFIHSFSPFDPFLSTEKNMTPLNPLLLSLPLTIKVKVKTKPKVKTTRSSQTLKVKPQPQDPYAGW